MKTLTLPLLCLSLAIPSFAEKAVPLDNFELSMSFGSKQTADQAYTHITLSGALKPGAERPSFEASYLCGNVTNTRDGSTTNHFPLTREDIGALIRVAHAAQKESPMKVEVDYENSNWVTTYEARETDGEWKVLMTRDHWAGEFAAAEGERLGGLLDECVSAIAWYEKLFTATELPEPSPDARPPVMVDDMTMTASFGEVSLGDFGYRSDFSYGSTERLPANTHHHLAVHYIHQSPQQFEGQWVRSLMAKASEASEAAQKLESYNFRARNREMTYEITAMPDKRMAEVRLHSDYGRDSFLTRVSKLSPSKAREVAEVLDRAEQFERWFAKHHTLLAANKP